MGGSRGTAPPADGATQDSTLLEAASAGRGARRELLGAAVCWCLFVNHYSRDVTGALEREIEADVGVSVNQFQALNSVYFFPNVLAPLIVGAVAQRVGSTRMLIAMQFRSYNILLAGRVILGLTYESTDVLPLPILAPFFSEWGSMVGIFNSALRMGSVVNFALSPLAYKMGALAAALWLSGILGISGLGAAALARGLERKLRPAVRRDEAEQRPGVGASEDATSPGSSTSVESGRVAGCSGVHLFVLFVVTGALIYTSIVPFWFFGSAFIRDKWGYSLQSADALMLFPEGGMVVLATPIGFLVDARRRRVGATRACLLGLVMALCGVVLGYALLVIPTADVMPPIVPLAVLGLAYACGNTVFWSLTNALVPSTCYALGGGILGSAMNLGPTVLPLLMADAGSEATAISWLGFAAAMAMAGALALAACPALPELAA